MSQQQEAISLNLALLVVSSPYGEVTERQIERDLVK
jgi:hypothetical protein